MLKEILIKIFLKNPMLLSRGGYRYRCQQSEYVQAMQYVYTVCNVFHAIGFPESIVRNLLLQD